MELNEFLIELNEFSVVKSSDIVYPSMRQTFKEAKYYGYSW